MNKKVNLDKGAIKLLYSHYKNYIVPIAIIIACIILFFLVIIPQIQNVITLQQEQRREEEKLEILKNNLNLLYNLDSNTLDKQLKLTSKALPVNKDFIGILSGIAVASSKASVTLGDYGFQVGDINKTPTNVKGVPSLELSLTVNGDLNNLISFIKELEKTIPISEIIGINLTSRNATIKTLFYYKPLPQVKIRDDQPLSPLSQSTITEIDNLSKLNNANISDEVVPAQNSSSKSAVFSGF